MIRALSEAEKRFVLAIGGLSALCIVFYAHRAVISRTFRFDFIFGNLALAWLGLIFGWLLVQQLTKTRWLSWQNLGLSILWLMFLPNTWYVLTDFLHVHPTGEVSELYDIVLISILVICGFALGFASLYLVHQEFRKRFSEQRSTLLVAGVIFVSSFSIYLGRVLRWNSWDVITNPSGVILNVSDRIIDPLGHQRAFNITGLFFVLICSVYFALWYILRSDKPRANKR